MLEHKHKWKKSTRKHGNLQRFYVVCQDPECGIEKQASLIGGHLHTFTTGISRGGKSQIKSYRLKPWQKMILEDSDLTFVQFVDKAFNREKTP